MADPARPRSPSRTDLDRLRTAPPEAAAPTRVIIEMRPSAALGAAGRGAGLRPLFDRPDEGPRMGATDAPRWYLADLPHGAETAWDLAHARVADQLGVASEHVLHVEPDLVHAVYPLPHVRGTDPGLAAAGDCDPRAQNNDGGQASGDVDGWHLGDGYSQLRRAQEAVAFGGRRTRIAHLDTGYDRGHGAAPERVLRALERSFVEDDADPSSAHDPDGSAWPLDNTGHGTGTLGILAGGRSPALGDAYLGGAPHADVVPLRIADSVVLLKTSAFARALDHAIACGCDVVSMSMGGLPSKAWRATVDRAYEAGVCVVTAAGNNVGGLPTRRLVYPARYGRVIGVTGMMADHRPYTDLGGFTMEGNFGPASRMSAAMAAYSPNVPWALFGCGDRVRMDGGGTSSATPQVAAAAALWFEKYKDRLPRDWRRVEAVRHALEFTAATADEAGRPFDPERVGWGVLRAADALAVQPALDLARTESDSDWLPLLRVLTGLGIDAASPRERMFNVELAQRWVLNPEVQALVADPAEVRDLSTLGDPRSARSTLRRVLEALIADPGASRALRRHLAGRYRTIVGSSPGPTADAVVREPPRACDAAPPLTPPSTRRLRVYAVDPSLSGRIDTAGLNEATLQVRWEPLNRGPIGEYLAVYDYDASGHRHRGVDLDDPRLLARDGWAPSEGNPQFHQQMVYAVAMKTIEHFERATGRPALWRAAPNPDDDTDDGGFVERLKIRPHAHHQANAYYSPAEVALEFGYFDARASHPATVAPGTRVYTCLSHDIIAHETTHALLDGMHARFREPTNPDVLAFHEAFADLVALMQHFAMEDVLRGEIARTRGDLETESRLGQLAVQFGRATGRRGALRDAIGRIDNGTWTRRTPDPSALDRLSSPHARGAILVAAVFDAFLAIYRTRTADLLRLSTGGTGVLPEGALSPDLVERMAAEAAKSAGHVLNICIRALDYTPPVDLTFFEYLRAIITADFDLVPDDPYHYRVAFVEAFRRHGIYPDETDGVSPRILSVDTLRWHGLDDDDVADELVDAVRAAYDSVGASLRKYADDCTYFESRQALFDETRKARIVLHAKLEKAFRDTPEFAVHLGLEPDRSFEVHALRRAMRTSPAGRIHPQVIVALTQTTRVAGDPDAGIPPHEFRGGSTLVVELSPRLRVRYSITKRIDSARRRARVADFQGRIAADPLLGIVLGVGGGEPFAALHGNG